MLPPAKDATSAAPPGYRFVVQFVDTLTEADARARFARMFGKHKAAKARFEPGVCVRHSKPVKTLANGWHGFGWRVYLPVGEPSYDDGGIDSQVAKLPEQPEGHRLGAKPYSHCGDGTVVGVEQGISSQAVR